MEHIWQLHVKLFSSLCFHLRETVVISKHKINTPSRMRKSIAVSELFLSLTTKVEASNKFALQSKYIFYSWAQPAAFLKEIYFCFHSEKQEISIFQNIRYQTQNHKSTEKKELILSSSHRWCSESKWHVSNILSSHSWALSYSTNFSISVTVEKDTRQGHKRMISLTVRLWSQHLKTTILLQKTSKGVMLIYINFLCDVTQEPSDWWC